MAGRWTMASIQTSFAVMPALVYLFAGLSPERGLDRHRGRVHHAADAAVLADLVAAQRRRRHPDLDRAVRPRLRVPRPAGRHPPRHARARRAWRGEVRFEDVSFRYDEDAWTLRDIDLEVPAGTRTAIVGETGSGKTTLGYLAARLYDPDRGRVRSTASTSAS